MRFRIFPAPKAALRPANLADAPDLSTIHAEGGFSGSWTTGDFESLLADKAVITEIACHSRAPAKLFGFVMSRIAADEAEILTIAIRRTHRGNGYGRRLLDTHLPRLAASGVKMLYLEVEEDNKPAITLYENTGFIVAGIRKTYYRKPDGRLANAIIMKRALTNL